MTILRFAAIAAALFILTGCVGTVKRAAHEEMTVRADFDTCLAEDELYAAHGPVFDEHERYGLALDHFMLARDYERRGMYDMTEQLYETAFDFWPKSRHLRSRLVPGYLRNDEYEKIVGLFFRECETLDSLTTAEKRIIIHAYINLGNIAKAIEVIESLGDARNEEETLRLLSLYKMADKPDESYRIFKEFFSGNEAAIGKGIGIVQRLTGVTALPPQRLEEAERLAEVLREACSGNNAEVMSLLGNVKYMRGDTAAAVALFKEALTLDPNEFEALRLLALIHHESEQYEEAVTYYKRLAMLESVGEEIRTVYRMTYARILVLDLGDYESAISTLDTLMAAEISGKDAGYLYQLYLLRGTAYSSLYKYDETVRDFKAAIDLDSTTEVAWRVLAYAYIAAKDNENMRIFADQYRAVFPQSEMAWKINAHVYGAEEKYEEAAAAMRKALELDPTDYYGWIHLGYIYGEYKKHTDDAVDAYRAALRLRPNSSAAMNNIGYTWAEAGINLDSAKILIEAALAMDSLNAVYLDSYAWVFYKTGDYKTALRYMNKAMEQKAADSDVADSPVLYEHLGDILFKLKDYRGAQTAYERSIELKTKDGERIKGRLVEIEKMLEQRR